MFESEVFCVGTAHCLVMFCAMPEPCAKGIAMLLCFTEMLWSTTTQDMAVTVSAKGVGAAKAVA